MMLPFPPCEEREGTVSGGGNGEGASKASEVRKCWIFAMQSDLAAWRVRLSFWISTRAVANRRVSRW
jgi:hypothetical protein